MYTQTGTYTQDTQRWMKEEEKKKLKAVRRRRVVLEQKKGSKLKAKRKKMEFMKVIFI